MDEEGRIGFLAGDEFAFEEYFRDRQFRGRGWYRSGHHLELVVIILCFVLFVCVIIEVVNRRQLWVKWVVVLSP
jgi:hypothetical protein